MKSLTLILTFCSPPPTLDFSGFAKKDEDNVFTGKNTFTGGKFWVKGTEASLTLSNTGTIVSSSYYTTTKWNRSFAFYDNDIDVGRIGINAQTTNKVPTANFLGLLIGQGQIHNSQYKFYPARLDTPTTWRMDAGDSTIVDTTDVKMTFGSAKRNTYVRSNETDLLHLRNTQSYKIWDAFNLPDPASKSDIPIMTDVALKSGTNVFTGKNTFNKGQFNVGAFSVTNENNLLVNITATSTNWANELRFQNNSNNILSGAFGVKGNQSNVDYAYISLGNTTYDNSQYRFFSTRMIVPQTWNLEDNLGNGVMISENTQAIHFGRLLGTTHIRSGDSDLYHTKNGNNYTIMDESNLSTYLPAAPKWTYGFVGMGIGGEVINLNTAMVGVDTPKIVGNYTGPSYLTNAPSGMSYGSVIQIWNGAQNNSDPQLSPQLAFDVNHNVANSTRYMYFRTANNLGYGDSTTWKRVVTADEEVAKLSIDSSGYPALIGVNYSTFPYTRVTGNGLLPNVQKSLANGGASYLGTENWSFSRMYTNEMYCNTLHLGVENTWFTGDASTIYGYTKPGQAARMKLGSLLVHSSYDGTHNSSIPANGIYSLGTIRTGNNIIIDNGNSLGNYDEGIRIAKASNGYAGIQLGVNKDATVGYVEGQWGMSVTPQDSFVINGTRAPENTDPVYPTGLCITKNNAGMYFNGKEVATKDDITTAVGGGGGGIPTVKYLTSTESETYTVAEGENSIIAKRIGNLTIIPSNEFSIDIYGLVGVVQDTTRRYDLNIMMKYDCVRLSGHAASTNVVLMKADNELYEVYFDTTYLRHAKLSKNKNDDKMVLNIINDMI